MGGPRRPRGPFTEGIFEGLERGMWKCIAVDYPWDHKMWSAKGVNSRHASHHYPVMNFAQAKALPIGDLAAADCWLFWWTTWPHLEQSMFLLKHYGFKYSSNFITWVKLNPRAGDLLAFTERDFHLGTGYTSRKNSEIVLLGRRGSPKILAKPRELLIAPRREHSRKPDDFLPRVEMFCPGPRLELFSRTDRPDWTAWGNEVGKFNPTHEPRLGSEPYGPPWPWPETPLLEIRP